MSDNQGAGMTTPMTDDRFEEIKRMTCKTVGCPIAGHVRERELIAEVERLRSELETALQTIENMNDDSMLDYDDED